MVFAISCKVIFRHTHAYGGSFVLNIIATLAATLPLITKTMTHATDLGMTVLYRTDHYADAPILVVPMTR